MRARSASAFFFSASMRSRSSSASRRLVSARSLSALAACACSSARRFCSSNLPAFFVGPLFLALGRLPAFLGQTLLLFEPTSLLRFLAPFPFDQCEPLLFFGPALRQRLLLPLQRLDPFRLHLAPARQLGDAFRLPALALGCRMLALTPSSVEVGEPFLLRDSPKASLLRLLLDPLDPLAFLLAPLFLALAQAFELVGNLLLIDDHRLDRLGPFHLGAGRDVHRGVPEPEHQHRSNYDVEQYRVYDRQQPIRQRFSLHCRCGVSVINPTLGAPARCSTDIRTTTSP